MYVEGENDGLMLVHPTGLAGALVGVVSIDPEGERARQGSYVTIKDLGLRQTLERTLREWRAAQREGTLQVEYLGVRNVPETGNRPCYMLRRSHPADARGVTQSTIAIDHDTWFQVGTVLTGEDGALIGRYFYRDIQLNPSFDPDPFQAAALQD